MQLYFIRHAQSSNNALWDRIGSNIGRSEDPELTEIGEIQVGMLSEFIRNSRDYYLDRYVKTGKPVEFNISHLYTSPMVRAVDTAINISKNIGIKPVLFKDIHEAGGIYLGGDVRGDPRVSLPGKNRQYFLDHYPELDLPDWLGAAGWWNRPYEEREERLPRAKKVLIELLTRHGGTDHNVIVVSHGAFYNYFMRALLEIPLEMPCGFTIYNASICRIDFSDGEFSLIYLNRIDHLTNDLITG